MIVDTISQTSNKVCGLLGSVVHHPILAQTLEQLDLEVKLATVEALVHEIPEPCPSQAISLSLNAVSDAVNRIHEELERIHNRVKEHEQLWFPSWRSISYQENLHVLETLKCLLDSRVDFLIKLLTIPRNSSRMIQDGNTLH